MFFERDVDGEKWAVAYDKAIRDDGSLLFPRKLSKEFLDRQRKIQGSYIFAHQYLNEIIPSEDQDFKREWLMYYKELPKNLTNVVVIDPAISLEDGACFTSLVVLGCDENNHRYLRIAKRMRITATETVKLVFDVAELIKPQVIGIESVAYQMALLHFILAEQRKRGISLPLHSIKRAPDKSKMTRIRSLVPWFEWQNTSVKQGLYDFESEYLKFPRGSFVDILDALADAQELAYPPDKPEESKVPPPTNSPAYEKWYIKNKLAQASQEREDD
jgi:hypothetical protein